MVLHSLYLAASKGLCKKVFPLLNPRRPNQRLWRPPSRLESPWKQSETPKPPSQYPLHHLDKHLRLCESNNQTSHSKSIVWRGKMSREDSQWRTSKLCLKIVLRAFQCKLLSNTDWEKALPFVGNYCAMHRYQSGVTNSILPPIMTKKSVFEVVVTIFKGLAKSYCTEFEVCRRFWQF